MSGTTRNLRFWMVATLVIFLFWSVSSRIQKNERQLAFSDFMAQLERGHIARSFTRCGAVSCVARRRRNDLAGAELRHVERD
jgi:hypothetical protein